MKTRFLSLLLPLIFSSALAAAESDDLPMVLLLGDSIRMNYQSSVTDELSEIAVVKAPTDNCAHTFNILEKLDRWLEEAGGKPQVVHINVGLHDMFLDGKTGKPRHDLETYADNLKKILSSLQEKTGATVIFALTTVVDEDKQAASKGYGRVVRRNTDVDRYNERAREVAKSLNIRVNDLNAFMKTTGVEKILRPSDGIHLSPEGCELVGAEVARVITGVLAK